MHATPNQTRVAIAREVAPGTALAHTRRARFAWVRPERGEAFVGLGCAEEVVSEAPAEALRRVEDVPIHWSGERPDVPGPWFGGFAFDASRPRSEEWSGFGNARFVLPRFAISGREGREWAFAIGSDQADAERALQEGLAQLDQPARGPSDDALKVISITEDQPHWSNLVETATAEFRASRAEKIVGARRIEVQLSRPLDPSVLVERLAERHTACATWMLRAGEAAFFGATPETLVLAQNGLVHVDALAGTLAPDADAPTEKEVREHVFVVEAVQAALRPSCSWIEVEPAPSKLRLPNVVHLRTRLMARLAEGASVGEVALALHPTPAVCGTPREVARSFIAAEEGFDRGWYSGAIGWVGEGGAHLCVALRCGLLQGDRVHVYAGAGLVAGSDPQAEWTETSRKASAVIEVLGGAR